MAHPRQTIRDAAAAQLIGKTAAGDRVRKTRAVPHGRHELPVIAVYVRSESVDEDSAQTAPRKLTRRPLLVIESLVAQGAGDLDADMDDLALEIEDAMHADETLGGTVLDAILTGTEQDTGVLGDRPVGITTLTYRLEYQTLAPDPADSAPLNDFRRVHAEHNLGGAIAPADRAVDDITVQAGP